MSASPHLFEATTQNFQQLVVEASYERPVLVDFWAEWCGPCRAIAPVLEKLANEFEGHVLIAKVDTEANPQLAQMFRIQSIPALKLFLGGAVVDELQGALPEAQMRQWLQRFVPSAEDQLAAKGQEALQQGDHASAKALFEEVLVTKPAHGIALFGLAMLAFEQGDGQGALGLLDRMDPDYQRALAQEVAALRSRINAGSVDSGALGALEQQIAADPTNNEARLELGRKYGAAGRWEEAFDLLLQLVMSGDDTVRNEARIAMVEGFGALGMQDPLTRDYQGRLATALCV